VQEQRSEQSLRALNKLIPHHCHVLREGQTFHILANELVPGDIVTFATGNRILADICVVLTVDREVDESSPTGEMEVHKKGVEMGVYCGGRGGGQACGSPDHMSVAHMGSELRDSGPTTTVNNKTKGRQGKKARHVCKDKTSFPPSMLYRPSPSSCAL
jgi:Ca2+-transporting ATPase